jgi:hypothetical protein
MISHVLYIESLPEKIFLSVYFLFQYLKLIFEPVTLKLASGFLSMIIQTDMENLWVKKWLGPIKGNAVKYFLKIINFFTHVQSHKKFF